MYVACLPPDSLHATAALTAEPRVSPDPSTPRQSMHFCLGISMNVFKRLVHMVLKSMTKNCFTNVKIFFEKSFGIDDVVCKVKKQLLYGTALTMKLQGKL